MRPCRAAGTHVQTRGQDANATTLRPRNRFLAHGRVTPDWTVAVGGGWGSPGPIPIDGGRWEGGLRVLPQWPFPKKKCLGQKYAHCTAFYRSLRRRASVGWALADRFRPVGCGSLRLRYAGFAYRWWMSCGDFSGSIPHKKKSGECIPVDICAYNTACALEFQITLQTREKMNLQCPWSNPVAYVVCMGAACPFVVYIHADLFLTKRSLVAMRR